MIDRMDIHKVRVLKRDKADRHPRQRKIVETFHIA